MIEYRCTYCHQELRPATASPGGQNDVSHGICRACLGKVMAGLGQPLADYLNEIEAPVFMVNDSGRIVMANQQAQGLVDRPQNEIEGLLGGEVFGCPHANDPGGCGETLHCLSCAIRMTVMNTFTSGLSHHKVPACLDLDTMAGTRQMRFTISTEKIDQAVLLKIDEMEAID